MWVAGVEKNAPLNWIFCFIAPQTPFRAPHDSTLYPIASRSRRNNPFCLCPARRYLARVDVLKEWRPDAWLMAKQWLTTEGIIHELRESDVVVGQGKTIAERASVSR